MFYFVLKYTAKQMHCKHFLGYRLKLGTQPDYADGGGEQNFRGQWLKIGYLVGYKLFWIIKQLLRVERAKSFDKR